MKNFSFLLLLISATSVASSCEPAKQGSYEAPARSVDEGEVEKGEFVLKVDSSVERAIAKDTVKRDYSL